MQVMIFQKSYNISIRHAEGDAHNVFYVCVYDEYVTGFFFFNKVVPSTFVILNIKAYIYHQSFF